jgi:hypothetical protein
MRYWCSLHDDSTDPQPAVLSVMSVPTGEVLNVCEGCRPSWALVMAGVDPELIDRALEQLNSIAGGPESPPNGSTPAGDTDAPARPRKAASKRTGRRRPAATATDQEARVATELAERPDSAQSSAAVVDFELPDHPPRGDTAE